MYELIYLLLYSRKTAGRMYAASQFSTGSYKKKHFSDMQTIPEVRNTNVNSEIYKDFFS